MNIIFNSQFFGFGAALSAALFWSIAVIIFKSASNELSPYLITALKNSIATILFLFLFIIIDIPLWYNGFNNLDYYKILISGILGMGLADVIFIYALSKIGANRIAVINCFEPVVIYIFSSIILSTVLDNQQLIGFLIVFISILIMTYEKDYDGLDIQIKRKGIGLQILAVIFSSIGIVMIKPVLLKAENNISIQLWVTFFRLLPGMLTAWCVFMFQKNKLILFKPLKKSKLSIKIIISSGLGTFIALSCWIIGYANIEHPPIASILGQTSVIFIILLSWIFLKEEITYLRVISMLCALLGVCLTIL
tara:strand:- start:117 stop:1037 length:921 start_codon:yes stop_codon:yes gene_type:complete